MANPAISLAWPLICKEAIENKPVNQFDQTERRLHLHKALSLYISQPEVYYGNRYDLRFVVKLLPTGIFLSRICLYVIKTERWKIDEINVSISKQNAFPYIEHKGPDSVHETELRTWNHKRDCQRSTSQLYKWTHQLASNLILY